LVTGCVKTEGVTAHTLTGTLATFKEEGLGGEHKECFFLSVRSAVSAIQELLESREQLWVCAGCRFSPDHVAISSNIKSCSTCGESQEWTLHSYCSG
jgi:ribosomal protein L37AE/L43A